MPSIYVHMKNTSLMEKKETEPNSQSKYLSDSDSDDNETNPRLKTSIEERQYNTIPGSAIALSYSRAQVNPTIERGPPCQKAKKNKPSTEKPKAETSSTPPIMKMTECQISYFVMSEVCAGLGELL